MIYHLVSLKLSDGLDTEIYISLSDFLNSNQWNFITEEEDVIHGLIHSNESEDDLDKNLSKLIREEDIISREDQFPEVAGDAPLPESKEELVDWFRYRARRTSQLNSRF